MGGGFEQVNSASDVKNVNPYTEDFMNNLTNQANQFKQMFDQAATDYSPEAAFNYFFNDFTPKMLDVMDPMTGQMAQSQIDLASMLSEKGTTDALSALAGNDLLYSGATPQMVSEASQIPYMEAVANITGTQTNLMGNLLNTGLGVIPQSFKGQQDLYGNMLLGTQNMQAGIAAPEWWEPTYVPTKGVLDYALDAATIATGAATAGLDVGGAISKINPFNWFPDKKSTYMNPSGATDTYTSWIR